jgi:glutathionylspermidine synthase
LEPTEGDLSYNVSDDMSAQPLASHRHPTLSDILLNPLIHTLEPVWKAVTGSKALLPYMYDVDPNHENLAYACFWRNERMLKGPYLSKPVNGRAGQNITMFDAVENEQVRAAIAKEDAAKHDRILASCDSSPEHTPLAPLGVSSFGNEGAALHVDTEASEGRFFESLVVYQRRLMLKKFSGKYYPIFCAWMVGDTFGGVVVREDTSKITKLGSIVAPCRVLRHAGTSALTETPTVLDATSASSAVSS